MVMTTISRRKCDECDDVALLIVGKHGRFVAQSEGVQIVVLKIHAGNLVEFLQRRSQEVGKPVDVSVVPGLGRKSVVFAHLLCCDALIA